MSPQSSSNRWSAMQVALAAAGLLVLVTTFSLGSGFVYTRLYNVPDLTYEVLPRYEFQGVSFAGLKVENRGRATAHEVLVNLGDLHTNIQQFDVQCPELWKKEGGGTATGTLVLSLERMASGSSLTVYLLTDDQAQLDRLAIMADEGPGHLAADGSITQLNLFGTLIAGLALAAAIASLALGNIGVTGIGTIRMRSRASERFLDYENRLVTQDTELYRLKDELHEWRSGQRTLPPPARN